MTSTDYIEVVFDQNINNDRCRTCNSSKMYFNNKFIKINTRLILNYNIDVSIMDMINQLTGIGVSENEGLSQEICNECLEKLMDAYIFRSECIKINTEIKNNLTYELYASTPKHSNFNEFDSLNNIAIDDIMVPTQLRDITHLTEQLNTLDKNVEINNSADETITSSRNDFNENQNRRATQCDNNMSIYACPICQKSLNENIVCTEHSPKTPNKNVAEEAKQKSVPFICHICGIKVKSKGILKKHFKRHENKKEHICIKCMKMFTTLDDLKKHELSHTDKKYMCEECGIKFTRKDSIKIHMKIHENVKSYACTHCDKRFINKYNLQNHTRIHLKDAPYTCPVCNKNFNQKSSLNRHTHIHQREVRFQQDK